jgi:membrane-bound lytic murein transglycosylase F
MAEHLAKAGHVDEAIVLLEDPDYIAQARYGYCRGSEPYTDVRNIRQFYDAYSAVMPAEGIDRPAR